MTKKILIVLVIISLLAFIGCASKKNSRQPGRFKPGSPEALLNEGLFYLNGGKLDMAKTKLELALKKRPDMVAAVHGLAIVHLNKRDFDNAVQLFRQVIQLNPKNIDAYNYLGVIFTETGKYELAKENLLIAANHESYKTPENAYANLAFLEVKHKKYDSALRYVEKGIEKNKTFPPLYNLKGIVYENMKEYDEAIFFYEKALSLLTEDDITYLINIGRVYAKSGKKTKALDVLEKALSKAYSDHYRQQIRAMLKEIDK